MGRRTRILTSGPSYSLVAGSRIDLDRLLNFHAPDQSGTSAVQGACEMCGSLILLSEVGGELGEDLVRVTHEARCADLNRRRTGKHKLGHVRSARHTPTPHNRDVHNARYVVDGAQRD